MAAAAGPYHERQRQQLCAVHAANNLLGRPALAKGDLEACADQMARELAELRRQAGVAAPWAWQRLAHRSLLGTGNFDENVLARALIKEGAVLSATEGSSNACGLVAPVTSGTADVAGENGEQARTVRVDPELTVCVTRHGVQRRVPVRWIKRPEVAPSTSAEVQVVSASAGLGTPVELADGSSFSNPLDIWQPDALGFVANVSSSSLWGQLTKARHWLTVRRDDGGQWWNLDSKLRAPVALDDDRAHKLLSSFEHLRIVRPAAPVPATSQAAGPVQAGEEPPLAPDSVS